MKNPVSDAEHYSGLGAIATLVRAHDANPGTRNAPMIAPSRRGLLHKKLGVPQGEKIPAAKINAALKSKSPALRKEANFAKNFGK